MITISTGKILINPLKPYPTVGYLSARTDNTEVYGDIYLRLLAFDDQGKTIVLLNLDSCGVDSTTQKQFYQVVKNYYQRDIELIVASTHTHLAPSLINTFGASNAEYVAYTCHQLAVLLESLDTCCDDFKVSYRYQAGNGIGNSRLTGQPTEDIYLQSLIIEKAGLPFVNVIVTNCHPTIMAEDAPFYSCEYPGFVLASLEKQNPVVKYYFLQGCAGDVSTRFVRTAKTVVEEIRLCDILEKQINQLNTQNGVSWPLTVKYNELLVPFVPHIKDVLIDNIATDDLSAKEIKELATAKELLKSIRQEVDSFDKNIKISALRIGPYRLIFNSFEMYSQYNRVINVSTDMLVCYAQGSQLYLSFLDNKELTYETLIETADEETKRAIIAAIKKV